MGKMIPAPYEHPTPPVTQTGRFDLFTLECNSLAHENFKSRETPFITGFHNLYSPCTNQGNNTVAEKV